MVYVVVGLPIVLLLAIASVHFSRYLGRDRDAELFYFNCPHCNQRTTFRASQTGHDGVCRRCRKGFTFPIPGNKALRRE